MSDPIPLDLTRLRRSCAECSLHLLCLPAGVDAGKARAQFKKGVLTFTAPKRAEEQAQRQTVPIQAE